MARGTTLSMRLGEGMRRRRRGKREGEMWCKKRREFKYDQRWFYL